MPQAMKLSQQGRANERETTHALFVREAERQGVGYGLWCHASAWADAGRPKQWLAVWPATPDGRQRSQPVNYPDLHDVTPTGESFPSPLALDLLAAGVKVFDNPLFRGCVRAMSPAVKAALYCDSIAGGSSHEGVGVALHAYAGHDASGRELHTVCAKSGGNCRDGRERYPAGDAGDGVALTTGGGDAAMPHGQRRVTLAEAEHCYPDLATMSAEERGKLQAGYTAPISTDDDAPLNAKARRKALRLADGTTKTAAQQ